MVGFLGGNAWDWVLVFILLLFAIATGIKDENGKPVVPKPLVVRSIVMIVAVTLVFNFQKILRLFVGW